MFLNVEWFHLVILSPVLGGFCDKWTFRFPGSGFVIVVVIRKTKMTVMMMVIIIIIIIII